MSGAGPNAARASIVVVTARDGARLGRCLDALEAGTRDVPYELVIVLNAADEDVAEVARAREGATVVESGVNRGFAGGANLGRRAASTGTLVILHDDVTVQDGWLAALLAAAARHPRAGLIGPLVLGSDGRVQLAGAVMFADGTPGLVGAGASPRDPGLQAGRPVDFLSSCCVLVRAEAWDAAGGIDENLFPAGYGDADLAFGARHAGWDVRVDPAAVVQHSDASTLPQGFKRWLHARNGARFAERWAAALAEHEAAGDGGPVAVERALGRAADRSRGLEAGRVGPAPSPDGADRTVDPATLPARELGLMREYVAECEAQAGSTRIELDRRHHELDRVHGEHARLAAELRDTHARAAAEIAARDEALAEKDAYIAALLEELSRGRSDAAAPEGR